MKDNIFILGVGMTPLGKMPERSVKSLAVEAVGGAIDDAGCRLADIEGAYFSNTTQSIIEGQHLIRGQIALRAMGFSGIPIVNVENACASGSTAFYRRSIICVPALPRSRSPSVSRRCTAPTARNQPRFLTAAGTSMSRPASRAVYLRSVRDWPFHRGADRAYPVLSWNSMPLLPRGT